MRIFALCAVLAAITVPAAAQSTAGAAGLRYYVGTWSCLGGDVGETPSKATATFTLDSGLLREWILVPPQGKMTSPYVLTIATSYDAKNARYVQTAQDNMSMWWVSYAQPWSGSTEQWIDHASSHKLGHSQTVRTNQNTFASVSYAGLTSTTPTFKATCRRSSS